MQIHGARRDARCEKVVLELLVDDDETRDEDCRCRLVDETEKKRQHAGNVRSDNG